MEEKEDIFRFGDFLKGSNIDDLKKMKQNLLEEGVFDDVEDSEEDNEEYETIDQSMNPYRISESAEAEEEDDEEMKMPVSEEEDEEDEEEDVYSENESASSDDFYKLYKDKAEEFVCDIAVEGVSQSDTEVRLIIESDDWTLMFAGEIRKGKCVIPIKKLNILNEGQTGNIKLEVNADGNLFTPWEDKFIVKVSKKVTVKMNEGKSNHKKPIAKKAPGVKVSVRK